MKPHPYCYPGTNVYRNKFDIRDAKELDEIERDLSGDRLLTLPHVAPITRAGYRAIHQYLFQDLYDWQDSTVGSRPDAAPPPFAGLNSSRRR